MFKFRSTFSCGLALSAIVLLSACKTPGGSAGSTPAMPDKPAAVVTPAKQGIIRIKAGAAAAVKDSAGNTWLADTGFVDGETTERDAALKIDNTTTPELYRSEHYGMTSFTYKVPNGKYTLKLHFAETYEEITAAGGRVFSFTVKGHAPYQNFDVFAKAGGANKAYVETVRDVVVTDGQITITFTPSDANNPEINAIEIIPN